MRRIVIGGVTYEVALEESATVTVPEDPPGDRDRLPAALTVGTATATNEFVFRRPLEFPDVYGCVVGTDAAVENEVPVDYDPRSFDHPDAIGGNTDMSADLVARVLFEDDADANGTTLAVERGDGCDVTRSEPTLVVVIEDEDG